MSEETVSEVTPEVIVEEKEVIAGEEIQEVEFSEVEVEAMSKGWSPKGIEGKRNLSADEFLDRQPLYDKIHKTDRAMKRLEDQNKAITAHLEMIRKSSVEDRVNNLKLQKREALEEQNHDKVMEIDEQIIKASQDEPISVQETQTNNAFDNWLGDNQWYENNDEMRTFADKYGAGVLAQNPQMNLKDVYQEVAEEVKVRFSNSFVPDRLKTSSVESSRPRSKPKGAKYTVKDLDADARMIHDNLIKSGVMSSSDYISDLEQTGYFIQ